jgi:hypothetical protein
LRIDFYIERTTLLLLGVSLLKIERIVRTVDHCEEIIIGIKNVKKNKKIKYEEKFGRHLLRRNRNN